MSSSVESTLAPHPVALCARSRGAADPRPHRRKACGLHGRRLWARRRRAAGRGGMAQSVGAAKPCLGSGKTRGFGRSPVDRLQQRSQGAGVPAPQMRTRKFRTAARSFRGGDEVFQPRSESTGPKLPRLVAPMPGRAGLGRAVAADAISRFQTACRGDGSSSSARRTSRRRLETEARGDAGAPPGGPRARGHRNAPRSDPDRRARPGSRSSLATGARCVQGPARKSLALAEAFGGPRLADDPLGGPLALIPTTQSASRPGSLASYCGVAPPGQPHRAQRRPGADSSAAIKKKIKNKPATRGPRL